MAKFKLCRNSKSGRLWVYPHDVYEVLQFEYGKNPNSPRAEAFELVTESDDVEFLYQMQKLGNHDMNKELFDDIRKR